MKKVSCSIQTQPYSYQMELSELFESLSFLHSSSSVLLLDLLGLGGLLGPWLESPAALPMSSVATSQVKDRNPLKMALKKDGLP